MLKLIRALLSALSLPLLFGSLQGGSGLEAPGLLPNKTPYPDCLPLLSFRECSPSCCFFVCVFLFPVVVYCYDEPTVGSAASRIGYNKRDIM